MEAAETLKRKTPDEVFLCFINLEGVCTVICVQIDVNGKIGVLA